jgi:hypothetical protein
MSSRRRIARKLQRQELVSKLAVKCPVCGKTAASSEAEAWELARKQQARVGGEPAKRVYRCADFVPFYHWTRMEQPPLRLREIRRVDPMHSEEYWK